MKFIGGIVMLAFLAGCNPDSQRSVVNPPGVEERQSDLYSSMIQHAVHFRDGLLTVANAGGPSGKSDGAMWLRTDGHLWLDIYTPPSIGYTISQAMVYLDDKFLVYSGSPCNPIYNSTWLGVMPFDVVTTTTLCQGPDGWHLSEQTGGCVSNGVTSWGGGYTVAGDGDGTGARHGVVAFNQSAQVWFALVRKTSNGHPVGGNWLGICGNTGPQDGPGNIGDYLWLPIHS